MNTAILFDVMSIQQYIFGSNRLKDNLGASYIVEHIYDHLKSKSEGTEPDLNIGYIGGGNALVFTSSEASAKEIIKEYTTKLLYTYPGVTVAVAIKDNFPADDKEYESKLSLLFKKLNINKNKYLPVTTISSHGITDVCQQTSLSVEFIDEINHTFERISSVTRCKRIAQEKSKKEDIQILEDAGLSSYKFPYELDEIGNLKGEDSHIAIVHIDGNGFGQRFKAIKSVKGTDDLSKQVKIAVRNSFIDLLKQLVQKLESLKNIINEKAFYNHILPIRPIVLGGDDVTFICHGKLGIMLAEMFIENFGKNKFQDESSFSSCAGIAIVRTKYPFYRAYKLAESLCESAKKRNKEKEYASNWVDFQLAYSGLGNTLDEVRRLQYNNLIDHKSLINRPYCIGGLNGQISMNKLKAYTAILKDTLPNSKIKDLREILTQDIESQKIFIENLKCQYNEFNNTFCQNSNTEDVLNTYPFFDMIELLELYPTNLLK
jgi:hypothetical protein